MNLTWFKVNLVKLGCEILFMAMGPFQMTG